MGPELPSVTVGECGWGEFLRARSGFSHPLFPPWIYLFLDFRAKKGAESGVGSRGWGGGPQLGVRVQWREQRMAGRGPRGVCEAAGARVLGHGEHRGCRSRIPHGPSIRPRLFIGLSIGHSGSGHACASGAGAV